MLSSTLSHFALFTVAYGLHFGGKHRFERSEQNNQNLEFYSNSFTLELH
jgi:hypothetical protein